MERAQYCVYNQTSESFLSLGVTLGGHTFARMKSLFGFGPIRFDEGSWLLRPTALDTLGLFSARDLVYLDDTHRVVHVVDSLPALHIVKVPRDAVSLLALPVRTIISSQTMPGHQLVICVPEEMEFHLRSMPVTEPGDTNGPPAAKLAAKEFAGDRLRARRKLFPHLVAYDASGSVLTVNGVRDVSSTGLYLVTDDRWPLGTEVRMSLQRTDVPEDQPMQPIMVDLRVCRWGSDGVGLAFMQPDSEMSSLVAMQMR